MTQSLSLEPRSAVGNPSVATPDLFGDAIPFLKPWLGEEEAEAARQVILSGWICQGPKVAEFERLVASRIGVRHGVATNSCTSALHLTLRLNGIQEGDEVVLPTWTCMATANAIHQCGARPVFGDIDSRTYNLDPMSAEAAITPATKAIILVHQIGLPGDIDAFRALAARRNLILIEDGACSFGATYRGKAIGSHGSPTCFSFHPRKMITTAEGGFIATDDAELAEKARILRSTGASISDLERHRAMGALVQQYEDFGYNYRMTDMQAAIGLVQLRKLEAMLNARAAQAKFYDDSFQDSPDIEPPHVPSDRTHCFSSYLVRLRRGIDVNAVARFVMHRGVPVRMGIQPLHKEPFYAERWKGYSFPESEAAAAETLFLPIFPGLNQSAQETIVKVLRDAVAQESSASKG